MKIPCVKVSKKEAEKIRKRLIEENLLLKDYKVERDENFVYFPVKKNEEFEGYKVVYREMKKVERKTYEDILKKRGINLEAISIDFIGDIAIIRIDDESIAKEVADAIMETNKHVKTVCIDRGVKEDFRIRDIEIIAGERKTETLHKEHGLKIKLDVSKVYFSPRLSMERMRVAKQIKENDIVIDMFAGVAPFSLLIAKIAKPRKIYAIDINPFAVRYAIENVRLNKMEDIIEVIEGDARDILPNLPEANHIIMNLPHKSFDFLPLALEKGKILHYYEIVERGKIEERIKKIKKKAEENGYKIEIKNIRIVGSYSPSKQKIGMEIYRLNS